jgi:hypothetical protein
MGFLSRLLAPRATVIRAPRLAVLNLGGRACAPLVEQDRAAFQPLFQSIECATYGVPRCDVLFLYGAVDMSASVGGTPLRQFITDSGAAILVVGSDNPAECYMSVGRPSRSNQANLEMTLERKGPAFTTFFSQLFGQMMRGTTMLMAWVTLAPQNPNAQDPRLPEMIFACERGHIAFSPS